MRKQSTGKSWVGLFTLGLVASFLLLGQVSRAQAGAYVTSDLFSYSMTVTQYANPDDATAGTNPVQQISYPANYTSPQWNLNLVLNPNSVLIRTLFNNADPVGTVFVNPNAPTSFQAYWTSPALNTFQVDLSGGSSSSSDILGIPNPPVDNGLPSNLGTMTSYSFDATFSGLAVPTTNNGGGYEAIGQPTSVTGTFEGFFSFNGDVDNLSTTTYVVQLDLAIPPSSQTAGSYSDFFSSSIGVVPEPASWTILGVGLFTLALGRLGGFRRKK